MHSLVALVVLAAAPPLAEDPAYQHAIDLYEAVELEQAAQAFEGLKNDQRADSERALVFSWLGLTLAQLGRGEDAKAAFQQAVALVPDVQLPATAPPGVTALLEEARSTAAPKPEPEPEPQPEPVTGPGSEPAAEEPGLPIAWNQLAGGGIAVVGIALAITGGVLAGIGFATAEASYDPDLFQVESKALADTADLEIAAGFSTLVLGGLILAGGVALAFVPLE